jgi:hypothetical protein
VSVLALRLVFAACGVMSCLLGIALRWDDPERDFLQVWLAYSALLAVASLLPPLPSWQASLALLLLVGALLAHSYSKRVKKT